MTHYESLAIHVTKKMFYSTIILQVNSVCWIQIAKVTKIRNIVNLQAQCRGCIIRKDMRAKIASGERRVGPREVEILAQQFAEQQRAPEAHEEIDDSKLVGACFLLGSLILSWLFLYVVEITFERLPLLCTVVQGFKLCISFVHIMFCCYCPFWVSLFTQHDWICKIHYIANRDA